MHRLALLNGPNLDLLGQRDVTQYGSDTLESIEKNVSKLGLEKGIQVDCLQSNHEGILIDAINGRLRPYSAIIINPGGLTHTSIALRDSLDAFPGIVVEVHISNVHKREQFRHHSYISAIADACIVGAGAFGYELALQFVVKKLGA